MRTVRVPEILPWGNRNIKILMVPEDNGWIEMPGRTQRASFFPPLLSKNPGNSGP
jgi:hypothetical protein